MAEIVLDKVTKRYPDGALAVSEVDIEIADGEFIILVGPSGCGKSTTLNMIAGLEDISDGELRIDGQRPVGVPLGDVIKNDFGHVRLLGLYGWGGL